MKCGYNISDLIRIPVKKACNGYYLRWYYNGWHYWFFQPGTLTVVTEGEKYRTIGTRNVAMSTGQINRDQAQAIRTIMFTREVSLLTIAGWMNIRIEPGTLTVYDNQLTGAEIEFIAVIGSKEISYTNGYTPVPLLPVVPPDIAYCEIIIGNQIWMCKNFDSKYPGSKVYNDDEANRSIYGGLYTFNMVVSPGFAPAGWHVPTLAEWQTLVTAIGGLAVAGNKLKEVGIAHWNTAGGTDDYDFTMVSTGYGWDVSNYFGLGIISALWTADQYDVDRGYFARVFHDSAAIDFYNALKTFYFGVRLIKDTIAPPEIQPIADAGDDGIAYGLSADLYGTANIGNGYWDKTGGTGNAIFDPPGEQSYEDDIDVTVTVDAYTSIKVNEDHYTFRLNVTNILLSDTDSIDYQFRELFGEFNECDLNHTLDTTEGLDDGTWIKESGTGTVIFTPNENTHNAVATVSLYGSYIFRWENAVKYVYTKVNYYQQPIADAGSDDSIAGLIYQLDAIPSVGVGTWTKTAGPGTAIFTPNIQVPNAYVTVSEIGVYTFQWREVNGTCNDSDTVDIEFT